MSNRLLSYYLKANCGSTDMELPLSRRLTNFCTSPVRTLHSPT